ncbi:hypothetical protein Tco_0348353 [Tanacetum coccineum]
MGTKVTSSSGSVLEEPEIQKLQMQAKNLKENSLNKLNALKTTIQHLSSSNHSMYYEFREAFHRLFDANEGLFRSVLSRNMQNLEMQFSNETLHEKDSNSELRAIKGQFEHFMHSKIASHEQELKMTLKKLSERQLQIQQCKVQEVQSSVTSSGDETSSRIVSDEEIEKKKLEAHYGFMAKIQEVLPAESSSIDTPLEQVNSKKSKVISDIKLRRKRHLPMIEMDKQIKFLNEILYKRNQSIQTIHMLAPKCATYHGRSTFANPKYLKKAQSDKPRLYEIPYDTSDPANRFCPNGEETVTLEKESSPKLIRHSETI